MKRPSLTHRLLTQYGILHYRSGIAIATAEGAGFRAAGAIQLKASNQGPA
jgi:hypothetical protein